MGTIKSFKKFIEESIWSDMQDRSAGDNVRKEDEYDIDEKELERNVDQCIKTYVISSVYYDKYDGSSDTFLKCIQEWDRCICGNPHLYDRRFGKYVEPIKVIPSYIKENWETGKSYKSLVDKKISEEEKKVKDAGFIKKPGESISDTLSKWFDENFEELGDDFCEEIEEYNDEYHSEGGSRSVDLGVEDWWDNLEYIEQVEIYQDYMKKTNESIWSDMQDKYLSNINECDGVPGGLTPADVGGMGPAYFPGPNGEPGSGDLPSPTGIVYKQVAPFDSFIKIRKQKKKKKKFRKEDEPCVHSENPPIYSHVDDFRDYVDRTYDNIDKKK